MWCTCAGDSIGWGFIDTVRTVLYQHQHQQVQFRGPLRPFCRHVRKSCFDLTNVVFYLGTSRFCSVGSYDGCWQLRIRPFVRPCHQRIRVAVISTHASSSAA